MTTIEVRDLAVEAGGKTVVEDLSFTARAGDKIGRRRTQRRRQDEHC